MIAEERLMMITGCHSIIYSTNPDKDRAFVRDVLKFPSVDAGDGWLIFGLHPSELAFHPSNRNSIQEFYLLCDDMEELIRHMKSQKVRCSKTQKQPWGIMTNLKLPGGGSLKIYQPFHKRPKSMKLKAEKEKGPKASR